MSMFNRKNSVRTTNYSFNPYSIESKEAADKFGNEIACIVNKERRKSHSDGFFDGAFAGSLIGLGLIVLLSFLDEFTFKNTSTIGNEVKFIPKDFPKDQE